MKYKVTTATEALQVFDMLGIKNVSTRRQKKNGTQVYELPIQQMWQTCTPKPLRFACYRTGYVRNVSEYNHSAYQINKTRSIVAKYGISKERILIPNYDERLVYLANFILKNYYQKPTYLINDYVIECLQQERRQANKDREWNNPSGNEVPWNTISSLDDVKVIVNGHRYNLS